MELYDNLIEEIPEFKEYDIMGKEYYYDGISPLGSIGTWLNELVKAGSSQELIKKICNYLNLIYTMKKTPPLQLLMFLVRS